MKLESIRKAGQQDSHILLVFEDGSKLKTSPVLLADFGLYAGIELSDEQLQALYTAAKKVSAKERAVRIISATGVSERELDKRLRQKGEDAQDAREAVDWLRDLNLLDDARTAQQLVASAAAKGYGRSRVKSILYEKGIPRELWEDALTELPEMDDAIDRFLLQKLRGQYPDEKELKRTVSALQRRGHGWSEIQSGLRRYQERLSLQEINLEDDDTWPNQSE